MECLRGKDPGAPLVAYLGSAAYTNSIACQWVNLIH